MHRDFKRGFCCKKGHELPFKRGLRRRWTRVLRKWFIAEFSGAIKTAKETSSEPGPGKESRREVTATAITSLKIGRRNKRVNCFTDAMGTRNHSPSFTSVDPGDIYIRAQPTMALLKPGNVRWSRESSGARINSVAKARFPFPEAISSFGGGGGDCGNRSSRRNPFIPHIRPRPLSRRTCEIFAAENPLAMRKTRSNGGARRGPCRTRVNPEITAGIHCPAGKLPIFEMAFAFVLFANGSLSLLSLRRNHKRDEARFIAPYHAIGNYFQTFFGRSFYIR